MSNAFHYQNTFRDPLAQEFTSVLSVLYDPLEMAGLAAWYDGADESTLNVVNDQITVWQDKSGNNYHLGPVAGEALPSVSGNLQNGRSGVFFDYTLKEMLECNYTAAADGSLSTFIVAKRVDGTTSYGGGSAYKNLLSIGRPDGTSVETGKINVTENRDNGSIRCNAHKVASDNSPDGFMLDGKAHIISNILTYGDDFSLEGRADGVQGELDARTSVAVANELTPLQIGGSTSASSRRFWGTIYEVLLFKRSLTSADILKIETYLSAKWAVPLQ